ncbi:hypothetical protein [Anabaena sp. PCC 7108]|uniref:hypothetical protein n=1 Tax=Anabaena sp. PCC 7108 TaxID=163908 RepID=UPI00034A98C6|nr:hypothetical protein [Anabaena sp. PCC 7108]
MLKLLADENFDNTIVRGLWRRNPNIDIVRVQDVGLLGEDDPLTNWYFLVLMFKNYQKNKF